MINASINGYSQSVPIGHLVGSDLTPALLLFVVNVNAATLLSCDRIGGFLGLHQLACSRTADEMRDATKSEIDVAD